MRAHEIYTNTKVPQTTRRRKVWLGVKTGWGHKTHDAGKPEIHTRTKLPLTPSYPIRGPLFGVGVYRLVPDRLSCSLDGVSLESRIERFHLHTPRVAEVVPHLGLPVRGQIGRPLLRKYASPGPGGGPTLALPGRILGGPGWTPVFVVCKMHAVSSIKIRNTSASHNYVTH